MSMYIDAHFHADDLFAVEPGFAERYSALGVLGLASAHDVAGLESTRRLLAGLPHLLSFGVHPQLPVMDEAEHLSALAASGGIDAIGECGFDFFDDDNGMERTPGNEARQRAAFELQLGLALRYDLVLVVHLRAAMDLAFEYAPRLARLKAVIFHSWPGPVNEALAMSVRCPRALFSFGGSVLNGNKKARSSAAALPLSAVLTETDAPFQPPRVAPLPGARLARAYSSPEDLPRVAAELALLRGVEPACIVDAVRENFGRAFDHGVRR